MLLDFSYSHEAGSFVSPLEVPTDESIDRRWLDKVLIAGVFLAKQKHLV